jgi:predicted peptidase
MCFRRSRSLLISAWTVFGCCALFLLAPLRGQEKEPVIESLDAKLQERTTYLNPDFLLFSVDAKKDKKIPLVIYLHGAGGVGNEIGKIKGQVQRVVIGIRKFRKGPCLVVAPQCLRDTPKGRGTWTPADLNVFLEHLKATLPLDERRIYLTGNSMGGYGCWVWGGHSPKHFAAIAPVVGGIGRGGPKAVTDDLEEWATNLATVPVYAFAGAKDRVVPAERSERMIAAIRKAGGKRAKIKVLPEEGHGASRIVFSTEEVYDWMFSLKRD